MSNADWWAQKLNGTQNQGQQFRPDPTPPMPPSQQPMTPMPTLQQPSPVGRAQSAQQVQTCPECGSNNYMSPDRNTAPRCFECGYPVSQSGSRYGNLSTARVEGTAKASLGNDATSNWNPQEIIAHLG
jgi:ribosomal protein L37E